MFRKLLQAMLVVIGIVSLVASIVGCDKNSMPTAPTPVSTVCEDPKATNNGGPLPCTYPPGQAPLPPNQCWDPKATNYGGPIPCRYPPEGEVRIGYRTGFIDMSFGPLSYIPVDMPVMGYPGNVEARVVLDTPGTHLIRMALMTANNVTVIREVTVEVTSSGNIRLPFDGLSAIRPRINNANRDGRTISGRVDYYYIADQ